jgi:3-methyladenine DNA glycosylase AlkD
MKPLPRKPTPQRLRPTALDRERQMRAILAWLRGHGDPQRARGVQQYFKNAIVALGIDTPTLRSYAAGVAQPLAASWALDDALELCDRLLQEPELEIRGVGILILGAFQREFRPGLTKVARRWLETRLDNWALVDSFCGTVLSPLLERHPTVERTLCQWSHAASLWVRRAAMVTLVPFARRGRQLELAYGLAQEHFGDPEDLMHKAVGWLLREAGKTDMARLRRYLEEHGPTIPRTTLRYAIERFPLAERRALLAATRPLAASRDRSGCRFP